MNYIENFVQLYCNILVKSRNIYLIMTQLLSFSVINDSLSLLYIYREHVMSGIEE